MNGLEVSGSIEPGFEGVRDAFIDNFEHRGDTGAACAVYADGRAVVDIWAGAGSKGPWTAQTRSIVFSVSKGITTICLLMAAEQGLLRLDAPVACYWPEFGMHGKDALTVRQMLAHRAGLVAPDRAFTHDELAAWSPVTDQLAGQEPLWPPGSSYAYHALTFGWLAGEVLHRATGMRPNQWLQEHIATPLELDVAFGARREAPDFSEQLEQLPLLEPIPEQLVPTQHVDLADRAMTMSSSLGSRAEDLFDTANSEDFLSVEIAGGNLVSSPRDLARLYAATVTDVDGVRLLRSHTVADAIEPLSFGTSWLGTRDNHVWGTGFMLASERRGMAGPGSFGHDGAGGQLAFAHLPSGVSFAYQTIRPGGYPDDRAEHLSSALRACL